MYGLKQTTAMEDFLWSVSNIDAFTFYVLATLVFSVAYFIKELVGSTQLAAISLPVLTLGGLISNWMLQDVIIRVPLDKDSNVVVETGIGVVVALLLLVWCIWSIAKFREYRTRNRKVMGINPNK